MPAAWPFDDHTNEFARLSTYKTTNHSVPFVTWDLELNNLKTCILLGCTCPKNIGLSLLRRWQVLRYKTFLETLRVSNKEKKKKREKEKGLFRRWIFYIPEPSLWRGSKFLHPPSIFSIPFPPTTITALFILIIRSSMMLTRFFYVCFYRKLI